MANTSQSLFERGMKVLVEGVSSASRGPATFGGAPRYMSHGAGARLYDVDGREYIDWMMAFGALPLGHAHPKVVETVSREVARGTHFATALEVEVEVAEMLVALLPHVDKVRFANTGTEAAMAAFRLARGHTGRRKIIKFEGHYHGWWDAVLVNTNPLPPTMLGHPNDPIRIPDSSGIPEEAWKDTIVVRWNDTDALERSMALHGREAACVVTEGVMSNMGVIPPKPGYLQRMQELCREHGALFYLDETVTGFRLSAGGCAELFGLSPALVAYGQALGGGLPMAMMRGEWGGVADGGVVGGGRHGGGRDGSGADARGAELLSDLAGERVYGAFHGGVSGGPGDTKARGIRGDVDDAAPVVHQGQEPLGEEVHRFEVDEEKLVKLGFGGLGHRDGSAHACVVDQEVGFAAFEVLVQHGLEPGQKGVDAAHLIQRQLEGSCLAAHGFDSANYLVCRLCLVVVGNDYVQAFGGDG